MLQSSLFPGLFFYLSSSAHVTRFPVKNRIISSADRQKLSRTSTKTPSTSKIRISGVGSSRLRLGKVGKDPRCSSQKCRLPLFHRQGVRRINPFGAALSSHRLFHYVRWRLNRLAPLSKL